MAHHRPPGHPASRGGVPRGDVGGSRTRLVEDRHVARDSVNAMWQELGIDNAVNGRHTRGPKLLRCRGIS